MDGDLITLPLLINALLSLLSFFLLIFHFSSFSFIGNVIILSSYIGCDGTGKIQGGIATVPFLKWWGNTPTNTMNILNLLCLPYQLSRSILSELLIRFYFHYIVHLIWFDLMWYVVMYRWPIKVFRPCPSYLQAGYQYKREGQTMDQVLFSEPSTKQRVCHVAMAMILRRVMLLPQKRVWSQMREMRVV